MLELPVVDDSVLVLVHFDEVAVELFVRENDVTLFEELVELEGVDDSFGRLVDLLVGLPGREVGGLLQQLQLQHFLVFVLHNCLEPPAQSPLDLVN